jgi:hypothetical protein
MAGISETRTLATLEAGDIRLVPENKVLVSPGWNRCPAPSRLIDVLKTSEKQALPWESK